MGYFIIKILICVIQILHSLLLGWYLRIQTSFVSYRSFAVDNEHFSGDYLC